MGPYLARAVADDLLVFQPKLLSRHVQVRPGHQSGEGHLMRKTNNSKYTLPEYGLFGSFLPLEQYLIPQKNFASCPFEKIDFF